jgi:hypothetical protein
LSSVEPANACFGERVQSHLLGQALVGDAREDRATSLDIVGNSHAINDREYERDGDGDGKGGEKP